MDSLLQSGKYGSEECWKDMFLFLIETMETAVKTWHETSSVDAKVYFLLDKEKTQTEKYAPVVNIDKVCNYIYSPIKSLNNFNFGSLGFYCGFLSLCASVSDLLTTGLPCMHIWLVSVVGSNDY